MTRFKQSKHILMLMAFLAFFTSASAQSKKTFMWEVESDKNKVYLLGSIHIGKEEMYPLPQVIEDAYNEAPNIAFEIDISKVNQMEILEMMMLGGDTTLKTLIKPELYKKVGDKFTKYQVPEMMWGKMKPWAVAMTLGQISAASDGYAGAEGIDMYFLKKAQTNKKIHELETIKSQMGMFDLFNKVSNEYLEYSLETIDSAAINVDAMYDAWAKGDTKAMEQIIKDGEKEFPAYEKIMETLLYERNNKMQSKIEKWLDGNEVYFVIVGSAHLVGERGIVEMLRKTGKYRIRQR